MKTIKYSAFRGMNTKRPPHAMNTEDGRWVSDALNVMFQNDGSVKRIRSFDLLQSLSGAHSIFEDMFVQGGVLYRFSAAPFVQTMLRVLSTNAPMSYCRIGDRVYLSNGVDGLLLTAAGSVIPWGMDAPAAPVVAYTESGSLSAGRYKVALTFSRYDEESPLSELADVESAATGGFVVTLPTTGIPEGATHINVFITGNNGAVPMLAKSVEVGVSSVTITTKPAEREASRRIETVMPAGTRVFEHNRRMCVVSGSVIYTSGPYRFGYCEQGSGYVGFASDIKTAIGNQGGVFVATEDKTVFLAGQDIQVPEAVRDVLPFSAVPGTEFRHPDKPLVGWFSNNGIVFGASDGSVSEVMADVVTVTAPASGSSLVVSDGAIDAVMSCGWCANLNTGAVSRYDIAFSSGHGDFALSSAGLLAVDGLDSVDARLDLGKENFGAEEEKRMPAIYLGAASSGPLSVTVSAGTDEYEYEAMSYSETLDLHRVDPGKGLKANWFGLAITNPEGVDFELASVSFGPVASSRRV